MCVVAAPRNLDVRNMGLRYCHKIRDELRPTLRYCHKMRDALRPTLRYCHKIRDALRPTLRYCHKIRDALRHTCTDLRRMKAPLPQAPLAFFHASHFASRLREARGTSIARARWD